MKSRRQRGTRRMLGMLAFFGSVLGFLMVRLVMIQGVQAASLQRYADITHVHQIVLPAQRGEILDRFGKVLAMDVPRYQVVAAPKYIKHPKQVADSLAKYLPFSAQALESTLAKPTWYALLDAEVTPAVAKEIQALKLTGVTLVPEDSRAYPNGTLASQVLGMVGISGGGLGGIELADNKILAGHAGKWVVATDDSGDPLPQWQQSYTPPVAGNSVELTIDANIEADAQKWLKWGVQRAKATNGTAIILNPKTGGVLALANWPNFNPNNYSTATALQMSDFAVEDPVPPGSIFKPVTAAAAMMLGLANPNSTYDTVGYKIVDGVRINDWQPGGWGWITLSKAVEISSDQVFMDLALKLGVNNLYHFVQLFGFDHPSGVGLPGDSSGIWIPAQQVNAVDLATIGFGQGLAATPMQMIAAIAAIVNDGTMMQPRIVHAILGTNGQTIQKMAPKVESRKIISPTIANEIQQMMVAEATSGTGIPAQVNGYVIGGKTGTAQKVVNGKTSNSQFIASYMGFGPYPNPRFIMLVMIDGPDTKTNGNIFYGDQVAAPVWQKIAADLFQYWKIKPYATPDNGSKPGPVPKS